MTKYHRWVHQREIKKVWKMYDVLFSCIILRHKKYPIYLEQHSLQCSEPRTNSIGYKCSYSSESKCLKCWKKRCCLWDNSFDESYSKKCNSRHQTRKPKTSNVKYIRNKRYKSHGHKCYKGPESNGKRCFLTNLLTLGRKIRTDRHRRSVRKEVCQSENNNSFTRELASRRTSHNGKRRHCSINSTIHHLGKIGPKKIEWSHFFCMKERSEHIIRW